MLSRGETLARLPIDSSYPQVLGSSPTFPDQKPETKVPKRVGGKEEDWRSLPLQPVEQTLGDAQPFRLRSNGSTLWLFQRNSAVFCINSACLKGKHILGLRKRNLSLIHCYMI